jgi:hypothetical protein
MVLRALRHIASDSDIERIRSAALNFVERCRSTQPTGGFGFWPATMRPDWAPFLPADTDDTAIMTRELLRHGRLNRRAAMHIVCSVLLPYRIVGRTYGQSIQPEWIVPGAFQTWIAPPNKPNVIDCCVNANVVALMAVVDLTHLPGFQEAVATILRGIAWAGHDPIRQQAITPFYPSLHALYEAVEHAVECGVLLLRPAQLQLEHLLADDAGVASSGWCCSAYGETIWRCRGLEIARTLRADYVSACCSDYRANQPETLMFERD